MFHKLLFSIGLGTVSLSLFAGTPVVEATKHSKAVPITTAAVVLDDSTSSMTPEQAFAAKGYRSFGDVIPNFPVSSSAHWVKFSVRNTSDESRFDLTIPYAEIDELDLYAVSGSGLDQVAHMGRSVEVKDRTFNEPEFVLPLPVAPGTTREFLLRAKSFKPIHLPLVLHSVRQSGIERSWIRSLGGIYAGIMVVMALYNLFLFFSTRDRSYLLYVLYILAISLAQLTLMGYGPMDVFAGSAWFGARCSILFALAASVFGMEFARRFINTKAFVPKLHKFTPIFYVLVAANLVMYFVGDPRIGYQAAQALSGWTAIYLLIMVVVAWRKGSRQAGFFLIAWTAFLLGVVVFVLKDSGVLAFTTTTQFAMTAGSAVEGVLLSFALADRINILRKEKEQSQADALRAAQENERITRDQNVILEQKVAERTYQLQESLTNLKETQSQLVEAERMSSLGQLTAGIAHEINNPVNFIRSNIAPLKRDMEDLLAVVNAAKEGRTSAEIVKMDQDLGLTETIAEVHEILHSMEEGANRTAEIVQGLRTFSRLDEGDLKMTDLNDGIRSTLSMLTPNFKDEVEVRQIKGDVPMLECLPGKLNQVFMNMINNAMQAAKARHGRIGGLVEVITSTTPTEIQVTIRDNGAGMNADTKARIFEPFFTTKPVGEGTGLGLSIAHNIIEKHRGTIEVDTEEGRGTEFRIILPVGEQALEAKRA